MPGLNWRWVGRSRHPRSRIRGRLRPGGGQSEAVLAAGMDAAMVPTRVQLIGRRHVHMAATSLGRKRRIPIINALAAMMTPATMTRKRVIVA